MAVKSLNKAQIIGNLTKDPELRYTPGGAAVSTMVVATNRQWKDASGKENDEATFHRIVVWGKLAEICSQYLTKGAKVYFEGRISNREWDDKQGQKHYITEIVADDMIMLSGRNDGHAQPQARVQQQPQQEETPPEPEPRQPEPTQQQLDSQEEEVNIDDIPF